MIYFRITVRAEGGSEQFIREAPKLPAGVAWFVGMRVSDGTLEDFVVEEITLMANGDVELCFGEEEEKQAVECSRELWKAHGWKIFKSDEAKELNDRLQILEEMKGRIRRQNERKQSEQAIAEAFVCRLERVAAVGALVAAKNATIEGMKAENASRLSNGCSIAYGDAEFAAMSAELESLVRHNFERGES